MCDTGIRPLGFIFSLLHFRFLLLMLYLYHFLVLSSMELIADKVQSKGKGVIKRAGEVVVGFVFYTDCVITG